MVFLVVSLALIITSGSGTLAGGLMPGYISEKHLYYIAGTGLISIGLWTLVSA